MSDAPLLDPAVLDNLIEHIGAEAVHSVVELFVVECRELTAKITASGADPDAVRRAAHSLKSGAGQLGAMALAEAAAAVEEAAGTGSYGLPDHIALLGSCAMQTEAALAERVNFSGPRVPPTPVRR
jgi:HPt (histidine-containing phosphotransfer) domain-containing protein